MLGARANTRQVDRELRKLAKRASERNLRTALIAGGAVISNEAKKLARFLSGTLKRSIHVGGSPNKTGVSGLQSGFKADGEGGQYSDIGEGSSIKGKVSVKIGTNLVYAAIHEFGGIITPKTARLLSWIDRLTGERRFAKSVQITAKPYLRPAFNSKYRAALEVTKRELKKLIID